MPMVRLVTSPALESDILTSGECLVVFILRRNGTPPLFDVLPFEINNENYFLLIGIVCTIFDNFPRSSVG